MSLPTKLPPQLLDRPAVRGGGIVRMGGMDLQVCRMDLVALGHSVLHNPARSIALIFGVSHVAATAAAQFDTVRAA